MDQGLLPRRYAKALYKFAAERGEEKQVYGNMQNIETSYEREPALKQTISNPFVSTEERIGLLKAAAGEGPGSESGTLSDFFKLLVKNRRIELAREIAQAYMQLYRKSHNIYGVNVESATPLSKEDESRLRKLIDSHLNGATAEYTFTVNPDLIGGFVVNIESERLDASVKNEIEKLRLNLLK